ncbi:MAG TPA: amino acid adenylation domain-containing protein [Pyrinomonadaceae bacterium]
MTEISEAQSIQRRETRGPSPLSFAQQRLWFIDQLEPNSSIYNIPAALRLKGALEVDALRRCLNEIVRRHESLRTTFNIGPDLQPLQSIAPRLELILRVEDLSGKPETEREAQVVRLASEEAQRPFDLSRGPLIRVRLLRLSEEDHVLLFTMHHIISDGWSMGVLVHEMGTIYAAYAAGRKSPLEELPIQYADFAQWQREWFRGDVLEAQLAYWRKQLGGELPVLSFPTDRPRPPMQSHRGQDALFSLSRDVSEGLKRLSQREGATLFMTLMAAYVLLLYRHTGQEDILVGTPIANRNRVETEPLIGFFVNTLVLRANLGGNPEFRELLRRVRKIALEAYAHQDLPFERLVEELQPQRDLSRNALFQVLLALQNAPMGELELQGLTIRTQEFERGTARLDLEFHLYDLPDGINGVLVYNADIFEGETIQRFLERFALLLEAIVERPDCRLSDLPMLTPAERRQLLEEWAIAPSLPPTAPTIHALFEAQAARAPEATALICGIDVVSYGELDARAEHLARRLRATGVRAEVRVGLLLSRSVWQVVGLLGVLKAGGTYVPLDPSTPTERIGYVLRDAGAELLVTQAELAGVLPDAAITTVMLDKVECGATESVDGGRAAQDDGRLESDADEQNAAYVIYTSGSTGTPKGVVVSHASLVNAIRAQLAQFQEPVTGTMLQMSYAFDGSLLSIFCTLVQGGALLLPPEGQQADTAEAARLIQERELSHLFTVPSFYALLLEQARPEELKSLRAVTVGAEACPPGLVSAHFGLLPGVRLYNEYGPTEATIYCAAHECRPEDAARARVPIGRPASGARLYVLDQELEPVPVGVVGELYIGGRGVARGYMGQPDLTCERFVPDAFGVGERLYRTGDVARWLACGELELLGRSDDQVKVRGYRVEPGEVEAALCGHGEVREAAVLADEDGAGGKRLVAYVVAGGERCPSVGELREYLSGLMPEYMVPGIYVFIDELPRTTTGKVDRRALPQPEPGRDMLPESFVAPVTPTEESLARLWGELLKLETIGVNDNFFDLGGHSLLATQLISRVRESFEVDLPLGSIFKSPTIAGLARQVEAAKLAGAESSSVSLVPVSREGQLPLSFGQQRLWFIHQLEPSSAAYNMPVAVRLKGRLNHSAMQQALSEIVSRHESLRTTFGVIDGQPRQLIAPPEEVKLNMVDLAHMPERERLDEAMKVATEEAGQAFDLEHGPLMRVRLLRLSEEDHVLLFTMHHIISDGWSMGVLVNEVGILYSAFAEGEGSPLAPLPIQYADFAHWQRQTLTGEVLDAHWRYWKQQLGGTIPNLELPTDRARPPLQSFHGSSQALSFPPRLVEELNALARREDVTLFMLLLAAFDVLLHRYTNQDDILIGTTIANRNRVELEGLIGFFVNTLVLRTDLSGEPRFRDLLERVRAVALSAYAHQDMPFERLVEQLQPERSMNRSPLFQVMFLLQNTPGEEVPLPGLTLQPLEVERVTTQFDLSFDLMEAQGAMMAVAEYSTDLFEDATIRRMLRHYQVLLEGIVADADAPVAELPLLTNAEREQLLSQWNDQREAYAPDKTVHELFEAQVAATPDAIAVMGNGEQLTYAELNSRANQLAHYLRARGVRAETRVCVLMERSPAMLAALLGIIKAGGAYVPLDPRYPKQRLAFMLDDARASLILTQAGLKPELPEHPAQVVCIDGDAARIAQQETHNPAAVVTAENLVYVIYTSGSTGQPKGVGITHRSLVNHHAAIREAYELEAGDRVLQFASLNFDVAAEEIFPTLLGGATVVLRDDRVPDLGSGLLRQLEENGVTVLNLPSSAWHEWAGELSRTTRRLPERLRLLVVGSEPLSRESFARWLGLETNGARMMNAYGTTETTITATLYRPPTEDEETHPRPSLPVGRPLKGAHAFILDSLLQPVPVGVAGQLHIGGCGLARGYLDRPRLTAEKFIPHPYSAEPGARLYKTGDRARYLPDGNIEFLGRLDHQVKLRGFRIEPGEIEAMLNEQASVRRAVVLARQDADEEQRLVAYVSVERDRPVTKNELREYLRERLPDFMIPAAFVFVDEFPLTPGGKVDTRSLPAPGSVRDEAQELVPPRSEVERAIAAVWQDVLRVEKVGVQDNFFDLGGHSLLMVQVHSRLRESLGADITMLDLFKYPTISSLARYIAPEQLVHSPEPRRLEVEARPHLTRQEATEIAIIGMAGRFPQARSIEQFWQNLRDGVESVSFFSDAELLSAGVDPQLLKHPNYVKAGVFLEDIDQFDALFFGYNPREAEAMDPQHRLFLECAWEALERAGYDAERYGSPIGVFAGAGPNAYLHNLYSHPEIVEAVGELQVAIGNEKDHLPTHVSYKLNLRGPSVAVQAACSTSLVAVHLACRSLLNDECRMALAGGVTLSLQKSGYVYHEGGISSPDGHCRAFDQSAQGTIGGSGVGIVVLKRLQDALADGDTIHAVIKGSAINNDGSAKVGYAAPSVEGQAEVIRAAQAASGINPETIGYIEAHGTGTKLGDPIEVAALTEVFRAATDKKGFCAIGSLKTNMGHLDAAAGVGGLIKTVLALEHELIPPTLHFEQPNPALDLDNSPFFVNKDLTEWKSGDGPRRAGVSSFGIGGTNAHVILEEAPPAEPSSPRRPWQVLTLSAKTGTALDQATANLADHLRRHPHANLADVAYTLQTGRKTFGHRRVVVCREIEDALSALDTLDPQRVFTSEGDAPGGEVVFMFPGQGAQYVNMGLELYRQEPLFREQVDLCCEMLKPELGFDLRDVLFPDEEQTQEAATRLNQTYLTQPALFVIEYALAQVWMAWGFNPRAMIGHSIGEYVAACLAGVFSLHDALSLVAFRGRLLQSLPEGSMLSVPLPEDEIRGMLGDELSIAAINGPTFSVVSGSSDAIEEFQKRLAEKNVGARRLLTSHAFHSRMVEPIIAPFIDQVKKMSLRAPRLRYVSNVTGTWIKADEATDPAYWGRHLRQTVRFAEGARALLKESGHTLLEIGPGQTLSTLVRPLARRSGQLVVNSLRHPSDPCSDREFLMKALGRLWLAGVEIDWRRFYERERRHRVPLPTYPFERRRYWVDWERPDPSSYERQDSHRKKQDVADWFYLPYWKPSVLPALTAAASESVEERAPTRLIFSDAEGFGARLATRLKQSGGEVVVVRSGERFEASDGQSYTINIARQEDYEALVLDLKSRGRVPVAILHALGITTPQQAQDACEEFSERVLNESFYSLIFLAQALGRHNASAQTSITVLTGGMQPVSADDRLVPERATTLGPCRVIPQEYPNITCRSIDVSLPATGGREEEKLVAQVLSEFVSGAPETVVAYRGNRRLIQAFEPVRLERGAGVPARLKQEGVYLITGGFGGIGLVLAEHLAQTLRARLILVGRSALPSKDEWPRWLEEHAETEPLSVKIRKVQAMESVGAEVLAFAADVSDAGRMREVVDAARERFGKIDGVIHAAGISPGGMIEAKTTALAARVLAPKVHGTRVLEELFKDEPLDFLALFSSLNSVLGAFGQVDYCAANAFLDAFAHHNLHRSGTPTLTVNWDTWGDVGMAVNAHLAFRSHDAARAGGGREENAGGMEQAEGFFADAIRSAEGVDAFNRMLSNDVSPQVLVCTKDLQSVIRQNEAFTRTRILEEMTQLRESRTAHPRPSLQVAYVAPRNQLEEQIAGVWQSVLGIEQVGIHDDFFELGGHSLLATQLISRLRGFSDAEIPLRVIFEQPTVAGLAAYIEQAAGGGAAAAGQEKPPAIVPVARQARQVRRAPKL